MTKLKIKNQNKVVLVGGVFDILHYGHITFLKKARRLGDYLVVAIESDANTRRLKGPSRPIHNQKQRKETLESLRFVDKVIILKDKMAEKDYQKLVSDVFPDILATTEGDPITLKKQQQIESLGGKLAIIPKLKVDSTTQIAKILHLE